MICVIAALYVDTMADIRQIIYISSWDVLLFFSETEISVFPQNRKNLTFLRLLWFVVWHKFMQEETQFLYGNFVKDSSSRSVEFLP